MKVFVEQQRFTQTWLIVLILISAIMPLVLVFNEYYANKESFSFAEMILVIGLVLVAPCIIFVFKLYTRIDEVGIHYKFFPIHLKYKTIKWNEVAVAYVRKYDAISEFGGWGLKGGWLWKASKGTAINVSGDIGIQLELKNGKKLLIGTQLKNESEMVLQTYQTKINNNG